MRKRQATIEELRTIKKLGQVLTDAYCDSTRLFMCTGANDTYLMLHLRRTWPEFWARGLQLITASHTDPSVWKDRVSLEFSFDFCI